MDSVCDIESLIVPFGPGGVSSLAMGQAWAAKTLERWACVAAKEVIGTKLQHKCLAGQEWGNTTLCILPWASVVFSSVKSSQVTNVFPGQWHGIDIKGFRFK